MSHRPRGLWIEDCRGVGLDSLADLLEGYYRSRRPSHGRRDCHDDRDCYGGHGPADYVSYLQRIGYAYATLPLRIMAQVYGDCGPRGRDYCGDYGSRDRRRGSRRDDDVCIAPTCLCICVERNDRVATCFRIEGDDDEEVKLTFQGFKDGDLTLEARDELGNWTDIDTPRTLNVKLNEEGRQVISLKITARNPARDFYTGKIKIQQNGKSLGTLRLEVRVD